MGHVVTTPQQPPTNKGTWLNFMRSGRSRPSPFAIAAWTLSIVFLCQLDAMAQPCNPLINTTPDGGEINICVTDLPFSLSPDSPPINNMTEGIFTSDIPMANFTTATNMATVTVGTAVGSYSVMYEVTADPSGDCDVGETTTITLNINGEPSINQQPMDMTACAGSSTSFSVMATNGGAGTLSYQWQVSMDGGVTYTNVPDDATYDDVMTATLIVHDVLNLNNNRYRVLVTTDGCATETSSAAILTVEGPLSITSQPIDKTRCAGTGTTFSASASNAASGTISYQWEVSDDGFAYSNVPNNAIYNGANTQNLVINDVTGLDGLQYRLTFSTGNCAVQRTNSATLTVEGPLTVTTAPMDITACSGNSVEFSIEVDNAASGTVMYQWQESTNGGLSYNNLVNSAIYGDVDADRLFISDITGLGGNLYRVAIGSGACASQFSAAAELTVEGVITITEQPMDVTGCMGSGSTFSVVVDNGEGGDITYQWQFSADGGTTYTDVDDDEDYDDVNTATLMVHDVTDFEDYLYRVEIGGTTCPVQFSDAALLVVDDGIMITEQPMDVTSCAGSGVSFSVTATNAPSTGTLMYQWQLSTDAGITYTDVPDDATYDDVTTSTLVVNDVNNLNNNRYRALVSTENCSAVASASARLTVEGPLVVLSEPIDVKECAGNDASFTVIVDNPSTGTISYQWQVSSDNGMTYTDIMDDATYDDVTSSTLIINDVADLNGNQYRARYSTASCNAQTSMAATLTVEGPLTFTDQPMNMTICEGDNASFFCCCY